MSWGAVARGDGISYAAVLVFIVIVAVVSVPARAAAQGIAFQLERGLGTDRCPDHDTLAARVAARPGAAEPGRRVPLADKVDITVVRGESGYVATLAASGPEHGTRRLLDTGEDCAGLAQALVLILSLIADGQPLPVAGTSVLPAVAPASTAGGTERPWEIGGGGLFSTDILGAASLGIAVDVVWRPWPWMATGLTGLWLPSRDIARGSGVSSVSVVAGLGTLCWGLWLGRAFPALCGQLGSGALRGVGAGYKDAQSAWRPWWVAGAGLSLDIRLAILARHPLVLAVQASRLFALRNDDFTIGGLGVVYHSGEPGYLVGVKLRWRIP